MKDPRRNLLGVLLWSIVALSSTTTTCNALQLPKFQFGVPQASRQTPLSNIGSSSTNQTVTPDATMPKNNGTLRILIPSSPHQPSSPSNQPRSTPRPSPNHALITAIVASTVNALSRLWVIGWVSQKLSMEEEFVPPEQHFVWEYLNDRYSKDDSVWHTVLTKPPAGVSLRQWKQRWAGPPQSFGESCRQAWASCQQHCSAMFTTSAKVNATNATMETNSSSSSSSEETQILEDEPTTLDATTSNATNNDTAATPPTTSSLVVVDITLAPTSITPGQSPLATGTSLDLEYIADVVNFLITSKNRPYLGENPELVLLVTSPGGSVLEFGLAAAQLARLRKAGWKVTVCIDTIAASGGYMMAAQADTVIAAPFACVGSIGVMSEGINVHDFLRQQGIQPLRLKAGDAKNPLSLLGPVSKEDIQMETDRLTQIHKAFCEMVQEQRPHLNPAYCDGRTMLGTEGLLGGLVDRIATSDEYLWERLSSTTHSSNATTSTTKSAHSNSSTAVVGWKLHKCKRRPRQQWLFKAMELLPHMQQKFHAMMQMKPKEIVTRMLQIYAVVQTLSSSLGGGGATSASVDTTHWIF